LTKLGNCAIGRWKLKAEIRAIAQGKNSTRTEEVPQVTEEDIAHIVPGLVCR